METVKTPFFETKVSHKLDKVNAKISQVETDIDGIFKVLLDLKHKVSMIRQEVISESLKDNPEESIALEYKLDAGQPFPLVDIIYDIKPNCKIDCNAQSFDSSIFTPDNPLIRFATPYCHIYSDCPITFRGLHLRDDKRPCLLQKFEIDKLRYGNGVVLSD